MTSIEQRIYLTWRRLGPAAYVGGLGLSALAAGVLMLAAYFAGTAPHLPGSAAALEILKTGGAWPPPVRSRALSTDATGAIAVSPVNLRLLAHSRDPAQAPPIDISDLPPPARRLR